MSIGYIYMNINVFTDGSCIKHKLGTIGGYGVYFPGNELPNLSRAFTHVPITNQRAELYAIYRALYEIATVIKRFDSILIHSDSEYSIKALTIWIKTWEKNNWKTANNKDVKNTDLLLKIDKILKKFPNKIKFKHVKAHTGNNDPNSKANAIVDQLAKDGSFKSLLIK
jgi:ribonuclease HI